MPSPFRSLPPVNAVVEAAPLADLVAQYGRERVLWAAREELAVARSQLRESPENVSDAATLARRAVQRLTETSRPHLRSVINATGIVLHTNLGRAPMAEDAARAAYEAARRYLNLELDLASGDRSSRQDAVRAVLRQLTGSESATAVNNCAAATVIVLRALAAGRDVIVSRGQLIEIGGSFRIPEIMAVSGATLREVGTTNITRIADYERAVRPETALLMRIHTSNYRVAGFTQAASLEELVALGRKLNLPVIDDVGSGALFDFAQLGLAGEPLVRDSVAAGADAVLFSGDKLLGGPQCGIIVGRKAIIDRIERDPLMRAFRLDKMTLAALEATLRLYLNADRISDTVPILAMLHQPIERLRQRAVNLAEQLRMEPTLEAEVLESQAFVGGGSLPEQSMPSVVIAVSSKSVSDELLAQRLRTNANPVLARVQGGRVLLDVRTVFADQEADLIEAVRRAASE